MNEDPIPQRGGLAYFVGIVGLFLIVAALVWAMKHYNQTKPLDQERSAVRAKALADMRGVERDALDHIAWIDKGKGVVRLPVTNAMQVLLVNWKGDPGLIRSNLSARVDKATAVPPPAPAKPSPFE